MKKYCDLKKMKATVFVLATIILFATSGRVHAADDSFKVVPMWIHVHSLFPGDDGTELSESTVEYLRKEGYKGILFTPHTGGIDFMAFREVTDALNADDFLVLTGREISLTPGATDGQRIMCHVNAVGAKKEPAVVRTKHEADQLAEFVAELEADEDIYIWNHPWSCRQWSEQSHLFRAIELFNDFSPEYQTGEPYRFGLDMYLGALKKGQRMFVISGIDMHVMSQTVMGDFTTYVFPDEFDGSSLLESLRNGQAVAAFNSKLRFLDTRPSIESVELPDGSFQVKGIVMIKRYNSYAPAITIYKNGEDATGSIATAAVIEKSGKKSKGFYPYKISFGDTIAAGEDACYTFEIPHYMVSSPYCYKRP